MTDKKFTKSLSLDLDQATFDALKKRADAEERSMSWIARKAVQAFLGKNEFDKVKVHSGGPGAQPLADSTRSPQGSKPQV